MPDLTGPRRPHRPDPAIGPRGRCATANRHHARASRLGPTAPLRRRRCCVQRSMLGVRSLEWPVRGAESDHQASPKRLRRVEEGSREMARRRGFGEVERRVGANKSVTFRARYAMPDGTRFSRTLATRMDAEACLATEKVADRPRQVDATAGAEDRGGETGPRGVLQHGEDLRRALSDGARTAPHHGAQLPTAPGPVSYTHLRAHETDSY